ncbi:unnamed protein product [Thelazia callipaeda]|uniref:Uncharacterized protein n=1 Tax=Thelazia callipaeda TaxID=103827 RepID=A0A0N5CPW0_THECL|nr:unnamed protein product [Thelazia callipaeda]
MMLINHITVNLELVDLFVETRMKERMEKYEAEGSNDRVRTICSRIAANEQSVEPANATPSSQSANTSNISILTIILK